MSEIQIRRIFLQRDAEEIRRLQLNAPEFRKHYPQHDEWLRMAIREVVAGKRFAFGIYKTTFNEHGEPTISLVGSIILKKETYTHVAQLKNLYIKPDERERGYGRALFEAVEQFCLIPLHI
jgi:GNAT superfamily N-acetyltransferase